MVCVTLKEFLEQYCDETLHIAVTDSWYTADTSFDYRGVVSDILKPCTLKMRSMGEKKIKSVDVSCDGNPDTLDCVVFLYILVEK
jgi:hypothetical protein